MTSAYLTHLTLLQSVAVCARARVGVRWVYEGDFFCDAPVCSEPTPFMRAFPLPPSFLLSARASLLFQRYRKSITIKETEQIILNHRIIYLLTGDMFFLVAQLETHIEGIFYLSTKI